VKMVANRIPLTIIGGYLGAGKTTLVNHILRHNAGLRLAIIVNDFGSINIDAELIESQDSDTINLANGCVCCTLGSSLVLTLQQLTDGEDPPEHILIEASGVADPFNLGQYGHTSSLRHNGVIVVADAETVRAKAQDEYVGQTVKRQLLGADLILLNKVDLVSPQVLEGIWTWLKELVPDARVVEASYGVVPVPLLLGDVRTGGPVRSASSAVHHHSVEYDTWSYTGDQPLDRGAFRGMVEALPEGVIRAKGILYLGDDADHRTIFQLVGKRWSLKRGGGWGEVQPRSQLVMIGLPRSIDAEWLIEVLEPRTPRPLSGRGQAVPGTQPRGNGVVS
jgi:G3E family GTPase